VIKNSLFYFSALLLVGSLSAELKQDQYIELLKRLDRLEKQVIDQKKQIQELNDKFDTLNTSSKTKLQTGPWAKLNKKMSANEVLSILGKPSSIKIHKALHFDYYYGKGSTRGVVEFKNSRVFSWKQPNL
jgi:uncharacterized coiled-coil protein SlyX